MTSFLQTSLTRRKNYEWRSKSVVNRTLIVNIKGNNRHTVINTIDFPTIGKKNNQSSVFNAGLESTGKTGNLVKSFPALSV